MGSSPTCQITPTVDEQGTCLLYLLSLLFSSFVVLGTLPKLPGNNPVQPAGKDAIAYAATSTPPILSPVYAYTGQTPTATGTVVAQATNIPVPASPTNVGNVQSPSPSASPPSGAGIPSYQVHAPSLPTTSKPNTLPSQASGHRHNISASHTHASYTPTVTPHLSNDIEDCVEDPHHSTPAKPHHTSSSIASHKHSHSAGHSAPSPVDSHKHHHSAGGHSASSPVHSHKHPHSTGDHSATHHGSGTSGSSSPGSRRKRTSSSLERRSAARHVARSPNAGHRFMKYRPRTF